MYAIIKTGGKQYRVAPGETIEVDRLPAGSADGVTFTEVLAVNDGESLQVGAPLLAAQVNADFVEDFRGVKLVVFKKKRRKGYQKKNGHRQELTRVTISSISVGGKTL